MHFEAFYTVEYVSTVPASSEAHEFSPHESESPRWSLVHIRTKSRPWYGKFRYGSDIGAAVTGLVTTPSPQHLCVVAGGQAYWVDTDTPSNSSAISAIFPVVQVHSNRALVILVDYTNIAAFGDAGFAWRSDRLSWDGILVDEIRESTLFGSGWSAPDDGWVPFTLDLASGAHCGGPDLHE